MSLNISIDPELKKEASNLFNELGLDFSSAITLFLKQAVREQSIPFEITMSVPNKETLAALAEYEEMKKNPEKYKRYDSAQEMVEDELKDK